jgi:GNAT superfamily N-acetyltransferase
MNNAQIRDARDSDREIIQAVTLSAYEQYAHIMGENWKFYRENILATLSDVKPAEQIVAEADQRVVGTVLLYPVGTQVHGPDGALISLEVPEVRLLAVLPTARGRGVGVALMQDCIRRARQSGASALGLHTTDMMNVAMRMYEGMGFARVPALDFYPAEGIVVKGYRIDLSRPAIPK